jgi:hypothetical protein
MNARFWMALLISLVIAAAAETEFDKAGPQVGEQVPNLSMRSTDVSQVAQPLARAESDRG